MNHSILASHHYISRTLILALLHTSYQLQLLSKLILLRGQAYETREQRTKHEMTKKNDLYFFRLDGIVEIVS